MYKGKIINFNDRDLPQFNPNQNETPMSEELQIAIQHLIDRLRELGPLSQ